MAITPKSEDKYVEKCSTAQSFIQTEMSTYRIGTLGKSQKYRLDIQNSFEKCDKTFRNERRNSKKSSVITLRNIATRAFTWSLYRWVFFKISKLMNENRHGILLPKLFWLTVRKNCSSDREKLLKFKADGQEFAKFLRSLEQIIQVERGQNNFW